MELLFDICVLTCLKVSRNFSTAWLFGKIQQQKTSGGKVTKLHPLWQQLLSCVPGPKLVVSVVTINCCFCCPGLFSQSQIVWMLIWWEGQSWDTGWCGYVSAPLTHNAAAMWQYSGHQSNQDTHTTCAFKHCLTGLLCWEEIHSPEYHLPHLTWLSMAWMK